MLSCACDDEVAGGFWTVDNILQCQKVLKVMVREGLLIKKTRELGREVGLMKRQEEASHYVHMLTREIRQSLDRHTILYTTLVQLSNVLFLDNCAIWMPDELNSMMNLTHELKRRDGLVSIPVDDPELVDILQDKRVRVLGPDSRLGWVAGNGPAVAIRMPMLRVSNFKTGTPEMMETCYAILVLVLPANGNRDWSSQELEIVEVVADQVAVALSHAAVLEESLLMREKLLERNMALEKARQMALMANEARRSFQKVMAMEMITPSRSVAAILSVLQNENFRSENQKRIVDTMAKGSLLLSALIEDATGISGLRGSRFELKLRTFSLRSMLKEAVVVSKLLCASQAVDLDFHISKEVPDQVVGDETRILQAVMYMLGKVLGSGVGGTVSLSVSREYHSGDRLDPNYPAWRPARSEEYVLLRFKVVKTDSMEDDDSSLPVDELCSGEAGSQKTKFNICEKLAQLMHGSMSSGLASEGVDRCMNLTIRLRLQQSGGGFIQPRYMEPDTSRCLLKGMNILLADVHGFNQSITRKLLVNLGCHIAVVNSWHQCLETIHMGGNNHHLLLIDLGILEEDGIEMFARIRKLRLETSLLIVALTSRPDRNTRDVCLGNGIHGVICKPVILPELEDELQRVFRSAGTVPSFLQ
ncbi:PREDICTED: ethylene receptor 2-like isoform X2 [Nelumbo nucifera]|uniref:Ethylene receptor 2-like isoform X2 n=1 Tax=Nelumbo nucifera TaxID=4432 RepID=A0A1U8A616_NELNU|nr:PREDICTED: ethylene receptor 2-like isoform X2 [Nelumbo nucifera]